MERTTAAFSGIKNKIQEEIEKSKESIKISVAWFTNKDLLGQLAIKVQNGCEVEIIISDDVQNNKLSYKEFIENGGKVLIMPSKSGKFLHDKFALFDDQKLIAGSYNWTYSAEKFNHEFIIQSDNKQLIKQFIFRFNNLKKIVTNYDEKILTSYNELTGTSKEDEFIQLEKALESKFLNSLKEANHLGAKIKESNLIAYIHQYGAIGGANRLISYGTDRLQSGLIKLWEIKRLDLSFESIIQENKFKILFDSDILEKAQKRLNELENK